MAKLLTGALCVICIFAGLAQCASATEVSVLEYPKMVAPGENVNVKVSWNDVPLDKDYVIRVQLEDWDAKPPVCSFKDFTIDQASGEMVASLPVASNVGGTTSGKFVVAALSKSKAWDDCIASIGTDKVITVNSAFKFDIAESPVAVNKGSAARVKVSWKDVKISPSNYKLVVQIENWEAKPGFAYVTTITDFKPAEERVVEIKIPADAPSAKNCRFVAAFISVATDWKDVYAVVATLKDIEVK
ncbi:MAG: hypothetical protein PHR74_01345 [Candidatus Omnitrophica bacterium]|jgi:hypothetical protein|nr:hypothetical protein [Candidatus Omnitrophota bacterium]